MACSRGAELGASIWEAFRLSHETAFRFVETALRVGEIALQVGVTTLVEIGFRDSRAGENRGY
jgi:hypothetical protein